MNKDEFWEQFFEQGSVYKHVYANEIIEALMEDDDASIQNVEFIEFLELGKLVPPKKKLKRENHQVSEDDLLKETWKQNFLKNGGLKFLLNSFFKQEVTEEASENQFKTKKLKFMLTVLRVFLEAAVSRDEYLISTENPEKLNSKLSQIMQSEIGIEFLQKIDFKILMTKLQSLIQQVLSKKSQSIDEKNIISNALNLWMYCLLVNDNELVEHFIKSGELSENFILSGILYCKEDRIRQDFLQILLILTKKLERKVYGFMLQSLSKHFSKTSQYSCQEYLDFYQNLIEIHYSFDNHNSQELFNAEEILIQIIEKITTELSNSQEKKNSGPQELKAYIAAEKEHLLSGLIKITTKIISKVDFEICEKIVIQKDLIHKIFKEFLFSSVFNTSNVNSSSESMIELIKNRGQRKVTSNTVNRQNNSRLAGYELLRELINKSPILMNNFIQNQLKDLLVRINKPKTWNYSPPNSSDSVQKYVGLRNLGCICYMNSILQQFFMVPALRYNLLCVDDGQPENIVEHKNELIDDNMLHQLQRMFAHLELSDRSDYNPLGFTFSFKDFDGNPTNTSIQQDVQEFYCFLFDRLENALKPTPRKYLTQSIFGFKTCSQLICPECHKVKNRLEYQNTLVLDVEDFNSVYDSLQKNIDGDKIDDFACDGCKKKVQIVKRTVIAETPNVLIVHLKRFLFNMESFQTEKMNQYFEFPQILDLKPYSYHNVMQQEKREPQTDEQEIEEVSTENQKEKNQGEEEKLQDEEVPEEQDCYEYKLVGVNVHSGSANGGHYWSYINTTRGLEEKDPTDILWAQTDKDPWMEFNDSTVKDYKFEQLNEECFGDKSSRAKSEAKGWYSDGSYGKSGFMLFYERRIKKPIKIVVPKEEIKDNIDVIFDEKTQEYIKYIPYREGVDKETPNKIYQQVLVDNKKFKFENDVYNKEFFEFIKQLLQNVVLLGKNQSEISNEMRKNAIQIAQKATFDILGRCLDNSGIKDIIVQMIEIFEQDFDLVYQYSKGILDDKGENLFEIMLECTDSTVREAVGSLFKYLLCKIKVYEQIITPETLSGQIIELLLDQLTTRVAKNWVRFDKYLDLITGFVLNSPEEIIQSLTSNQNDQVQKQTFSRDSQAAKIGLEYFFKANMLERLLDFILQDKSPLHVYGSTRISMGGSYQKPNFSSILKLVCEMISQKELRKIYPLSEISQKMIFNKEILSQIIEQIQKQQEFSQQLTEMCFDNYELTRKISKIILKQINSSVVDRVSQYLKILKKFLLINDSLKQYRLEWIFGYAQIQSKSSYHTNQYQYGIELIECINDEAYRYVSTLINSYSEDSLLQLLLKSIGRLDAFCVKAVKDLIQLCVKDVDIARYIYRMAPHTYQYARFSDWISEYLSAQQQQIQNSTMNAYAYNQEKIKNLEKAQLLMNKFNEICQQFETEDATQLWTAIQNPSFDEVRKTWLQNENDEVIKHYPPQFILGGQIQVETNSLCKYEDDQVIVNLFEVTCQYMYGNPTRVFNLSLPEKQWRSPNLQFMSYEQYRQNLITLHPNLKLGPIETREWIKNSQSGPVMVQVLVQSKIDYLIKMEVTIGIKSDNQQPNVKLPIIPIKESLFGKDTKAFAHFLKEDPEKDWGGIFTIDVKKLEKSIKQTQPIIQFSQHTISTSTNKNTETKQYECKNCKNIYYEGEDWCGSCGESLKEDGIYDDYYA